MSGKAEFDARLTALWNRRGTLDQAEWGELYGLVAAVLTKARRAWLDGLRDERDDYVNGFFLEKVLLPAGRDSPAREMSGNYLLGFFRNYVNDQFDKEARRGAGLTDSLAGDDEGETVAENVADHREFSFSEDEVEEVLTHYRLSRAELTASAQAFLAGLETWQKQVLIRHQCADPGQTLPLSQLQEQFPHSASYYRVKQLGVLHGCRSLPADYRHTEIGRWLTRELRLNLTLEDYPMLAVALRVLCLVALQSADGI